MLDYVVGYTVVCLLSFTWLSFGVPLNGSGNQLAPAEQRIITYEEYVIEHEISMEQAKNEALAIDFSSVDVPAGCQECTSSELNYCEGEAFVNDHCCCDKRYHEVLPHIPHTCYLGAQLCTPVAGDCTKYKRLRECCCHRHTLQKWKSTASVKYRPVILLLIQFLALLLYIR